MGGWQSANPYPDMKEKGYYDVRRERNNNKEDTIIIPVDFSKHADDAFECGYLCCFLYSSPYAYNSLDN